MLTQKLTMEDYEIALRDLNNARFLQIPRIRIKNFSAQTVVERKSSTRFKNDKREIVPGSNSLESLPYGHIMLKYLKAFLYDEVSEDEENGNRDNEVNIFNSRRTNDSDSDDSDCLISDDDIEGVWLD